MKEKPARFVVEESEDLVNWHKHPNLGAFRWKANAVGSIEGNRRRVDWHYRVITDPRVIPFASEKKGGGK